MIEPLQNLKCLLRGKAMTEYELVQSWFSGIEAYDSGFEFWITGTYAVIVACHLG